MVKNGLADKLAEGRRALVHRCVWYNRALQSGPDGDLGDTA